MTQDEIYRIAYRQSAIDAGCLPEDFTAADHRFCLSRPHPDARLYLRLPLFCDFISYGTNIVVSGEDAALPIAREYLVAHPYPDCFLTPALYFLTDRFAPYHARPYFMAEYFLPCRAPLPTLFCDAELRFLDKNTLLPLYGEPSWSMALSASHPERDMCAIGAFANGVLVGLAGCSADCDTMWQIGIDVLPDYRHRGIASALVAAMGNEIFSRGKVPFYCAAWSNIPSVKTAIRAGFAPAWVHLTCIRENN